MKIIEATPQYDFTLEAPVTFLEGGKGAIHFSVERPGRLASVRVGSSQFAIIAERGMVCEPGKRYSVLIEDGWNARVRELPDG